MIDVSMLMLGGAVVMGWLASAAALRASCALTRAPKPGWVGACTLMLVVATATLGVQLGLGAMLGMASVQLGEQPALASRPMMGLGLSLHMLMAATTYKFMLPAGFGKAMGVWLMQALLLGGSAAAAAFAIHAASPAGWQSLRLLVGG